MNFAKMTLKNAKYLILIDQALLSAINFGSVFVLAKVAAINVFASFVVLYSYHLLIFLFVSQFLALPILVFLSKKWKKNKGEYLTSLLIINGVICFVMSLIAWYFLKKQIDFLPFNYFFLMVINITTFNILKRFVFGSNSIHVKFALLSTFILDIIFFSGLFIGNMSSLSNIVIIYAVSFFVANCLLLFFFIRKNIFQDISKNYYHQFTSFTREILLKHFNYAKWILIGTIGFWVYTQGIYIIANFCGVDDFTIGKVRTIQNLLAVFSVLAISIENHFTPIFCENLISNHVKASSLIRNFFTEEYKKVSLLFLLSIPIGLLIYYFIYFEKFGDGIFVFFIFLFAQLILICAKPFEITLKCLEKTKIFFISHTTASFCVIITFLILIYINDYFAIPIAALIATLINFIIVLMFFKKETSIINNNIKKLLNETSK